MPAGESGRTAASSAGDECGFFGRQADAQEAGALVLAFFHSFDALGERRERHGEADARVVPFGAGHFARALRGAIGTMTPSTRPRISTSGPP